MGKLHQVPGAPAIMQGLFIDAARRHHSLHESPHMLPDLKTQTHSAIVLCSVNSLLIFPGPYG